MKFVKGDVGHYMKKTIKTLLMFAIKDAGVSSNRNIPILGIAYLQEAIKEAGFECERIDPFQNDAVFNEEEIINYIIDSNINIVGFSCLECNLNLSISIAKELKKRNKNIYTIFGGVYATIKNEKLLCEDCIDVIIRGEGEKAIVELIKDIDANGKFTKKIEGCTYGNLNGEKIISNHIIYLEDLNKNVFPNRDDCFKYSTMTIKGDKHYVIPISSSRGCPYACAFCSVSMLSTKWRARSVENVLEEVKQILQKNKKIVITFIDDNFFVDVERSLKIMEGLYKLNVPFLFATRANQLILAKDNISLIKKYGCLSIEVGIENGSNAILKRYNKKTTVEQNIEAVKLLNENKINMSVDFIAFDDETSIEELKENIDFIKKAGLWGYYSVFLYNKIIPYEGTKYFEKIQKDNYVIKNLSVEKIYNKLMDFALNKQKTLDEIYLKINDIPEKTIQQKLDFVTVKTIPYQIFENLVNTEGEFEVTHYDNEIENLKIKYLGEN